MTPEYKLLDSLFDELFPILRSITGPGTEESIRIIQKHIPFKMSKVVTGTKAFDWTVPPEWHFKSAKLIGPDGEIICDASKNNLHILNYSEPVRKVLSLEELLPHLHSLPDLPDAIPYVTSYYNKTWGFCISDNVKKELKPGTYSVQIDTEFVDGGVPYAEVVLEGESKKEILLTSYICHPSLANNELSGPLGIIALYNRIKDWPKRRYTYRFLLNPETIGSLVYLHNEANHLKEHLASGLILTCLGGPSKQMNYKSARKTDALINKVANSKLDVPFPYKVFPFSPLNGSDERQFCAPGFNFPMGQISRTRYGQYEGYHNSLDTKEFMGIQNVIESVDTIEALLKNMEVAGYPINQAPFGEPQLGKRDLYPNINSKQTRSFSSDTQVDGRTELNRLLTILNMADGENDLIQIATQLECSVEDLIPLIEKLEDKGLIKYNTPIPRL